MQSWTNKRSARRCRAVDESTATAWITAAALLILSAGCSAPPPPSEPARTDEASRGPAPVAVVDEAEAYLGTLAPNEEIEKVFMIRNEGEAPLELARGGTTCKCTMSTLPEEPIAPGEAAAVRVATMGEQEQGSFSHKATILTNDPDNPRIVLRVYGSIRDVIGFHPPRLVMTGVDRERSTTTDVIVYSQAYRNFELESIESSLEGVDWSIGPAGEQTLKDLEARCGYRLRVNLPPRMKAGNFWESLTVKVRSDDDPPETREAKWEIAGSVAPRAQMQGEKLGADKVLRIGSLRSGEGARTRMTLTVHDDHRRLKVEAIEATPDFLKVEVVPFDPESPESGFYWVHVEVPKEAPPSNYVGDRKGEIQIITDHPHVRVMSFSVQFAVSST